MRSGNIQGWGWRSSWIGPNDSDVQKALDVKGGSDQKYVYVLENCDQSLERSMVWATSGSKVTEPSSKKDGGYGC